MHPAGDRTLRRRRVDHDTHHMPNAKTLNGHGTKLTTIVETSRRSIESNRHTRTWWRKKQWTLNVRFAGWVDRSVRHTVDTIGDNYVHERTNQLARAGHLGWDMHAWMLLCKCSISGRNTHALMTHAACCFGMAAPARGSTDRWPARSVQTTLSRES
jgi:hypothetical protein